jgi:proteasome lid subunit RPN8/RPN11
VSLKVPRALERIVVETCEKAYPDEGCGLLIGPVPEDFIAMDRPVVVDEARPLPNGWDSSAKTNRYLIDPLLLAKVERELSGSGRGVVGFFHSHPNAPAWPSPFDLMMAWPCLSYWIARVESGKISDSRSWQRTEDGRSFVEEKIYLEG